MGLSKESDIHKWIGTDGGEMIGFVINLEEKSKIPKYIQLYEHIKNEIHEGTLKEGTKLPSIRMVSEALKISKSTVENAYNQLIVEGYIESKYKSGYYVINIDIYDYNQFAKGSSPSIKLNKPKKTIQIQSSDEQEEATFNFNDWKKMVNKVLEYDTKALLSYGDVQGEFALRREISDFLHQSRGGKCHPDQIIVGAGIQYLFGLIAALFRGEEAQIAFEYPGFSKGMYIFEDYGYQTIKVPVESDGINIKKLEASLAKIVYVSPSHQYPTGSIMPIKKRIKLINWATKNQSFIIEDDYDSLLRYEGYPIPALQGLNQGKNVIYVGSFSKLLIPSLRISFMVLPEPLLQKFNLIKERYSQTVSKIEQLALANYMSEGYFERHIRRIKKIYGRKNQLLIDAFKIHQNPYFELIGKESGLHVMLSFSRTVNKEKVVKEAELIGLKLEGISDYEGSDILVLSYSGLADQEIEPVIGKLSQIIFESNEKFT